MADLCICTFDKPDADQDALRKAFAAVEGVEVAATLDSWSSLHEFMLRGSVDAVAVNLDTEQGLEVVGSLARLFAECSIIGVSKNTKADFIIQAMRSGCAQFVCAPIDPDDLRNAMQRVRPARPQKSQPSRRICVVGSSGGAGATTIACNLAMEMAHHIGERVALVDLNLEYGDVACAFDAHSKYTIADICGEGAEVDAETLRVVLHELPSNISIIARPEHVAESRDVTPDGVDRMFRMLADEFPFVLVDLPRAYSFLSAVAVGRADKILLVTQLAIPSIRNARRIYEGLLEMGADPSTVQILLNRYKADFERVTLKDIEQHFGRPVFAVVPNDYQYVSASLDLGHPIGADAPASKCRAAIQEVARKLAPEYSVTDEPSKQGAGLLSKLLGRGS